MAYRLNLEGYFNGVRVRSFVLTGAPFSMTKFGSLARSPVRGRALFA
jgi:hypothetical protein